MSRKITLSPSSDTEAPASSTTMRPSPKTTPLKKRKSLGGKSDTMTEEERVKLFSTSKRLRKEADRLPVNEAKEALVQSIIDNDTVIVMAETGSGKSTQIPQLLYSHPTAMQYFSNRSKASSSNSNPSSLSPHKPSAPTLKLRPSHPTVAITQPRRLPCISLAQRVSEEMGVVLGKEVGYAVRFESKERLDRFGPGVGKGMGERKGGTKVRFCTEGVLLRELSNNASSASGTAGKRKRAGSTDPLDETPPTTASSSSFTPEPNHQGTASSSVKATGGSVSETPDEASRLLLRYDVIIIDEAHERTLNTDFLLGSLKAIQKERKILTQQKGKNGKVGKGGKRDDDGDDEQEVVIDEQVRYNGFEMRELKLVVMSATIDAEKFSRFFSEAPILFIKGRTFPVTVHHMNGDPGPDKVGAALKQCLKIHLDLPPGDVLVFMPGQEEIDSLVKSLEMVNKEIPEGFDQILAAPLYRNLSDIKQRQVFSPTPNHKRKIVVSTNIAETGLTIPNIVYVVDSGLQKEKNVVPLAKGGTVSALQSRSCSRAAAKQRSGRAGRTSAGTCFRLYTELDFRSRAQETTPEIKRADLASALLQLMAWGQNPSEFDYLDQPERFSLIQALRQLMQLEAIPPGSAFTITPVGRQMLHFPINPLLAKVLIASFDLGCTREIIDIIALREAGNPILESHDKRELADKTRRAFVHRDGDHLTGMNVFRGFMETLEQARRDNASNSAADKSVRKAVLDWCDKNSLSFRVLYEAKQLRTQLEQLVKTVGQDPDVSAGQDFSSVMQCLTKGLYMNAARLQPDGKTYQPVLNRISHEDGLKLHPSSVLVGKKIPTIVYDEIALTTGYYAHNASAIEESWLSDIPGLSDGSLQAVKQGFDGKQDVEMD